MKSQTPPPALPPQSPSLICFIGADASGEPEAIAAAWQKHGFLPEQNYIIQGDGGEKGVKPETISEAQQHNTDATHMHYYSHGGFGYDGKPVLNIWEKAGYFDAPANKVEVFARDKDIRGVRHVWSCHGAFGWADVIMAVGNGKPFIFHSGRRYTTLGYINKKGIASQAAMYEAVFKKYGRAPNAYDAFEYAMLTSPETALYAEMINNIIYSYKVSAPKQPVGSQELERFLAWQLYNFRMYRINTLGHKPEEFLDWSQETGLGFITPEIRHQYLEDALIMEAARGGSKKAASYVAGYIDAGVNPNTTIAKGSTVLHIAAEHGRKDVVETLLLKGADIHKRTDNGTTPLELASEKGRTDVVKMFLEKEGITQEQKSKALLLACNEEHTVVAQMLIESGADVNYANEYGTTALYLASKFGDDDTMEVLLEKGAKVDQAIENGNTPLYIAASEGEKKAVKILLKHGASVNQANSQGASPLLIACQEGHERIVDIFLENGANVHQELHETKATPVIVAVSKGEEEIAQKLLIHGAKANHVIEDGRTALIIAAEKENLDLLELLLAYDANVNHADNKKVTALLRACWNENKENVRMLLAHEANVEQADNTGCTPLIAASEGDKDDVTIVKMLLDKGADPKKIAEDGCTAFYGACFKGNINIAKILQERGADVTKGAYGDAFTPLMAAAFCGKKEMVDYVLSLPEATLSFINQEVNKATAEGHCQIHGTSIAQNDKKYFGKSAADIARMEGHHAIAEIIEKRITALEQEVREEARLERHVSKPRSARDELLQKYTGRSSSEDKSPGLGR
ncbi:MAG: ankyrin-like [Rickettsiales bacterium]|jgi:ankyrin repeat protein|nr:ankyrin-like [Rickettsiales bacterium]